MVSISAGVRAVLSPSALSCSSFTGKVYSDICRSRPHPCLSVCPIWTGQPPLICHPKRQLMA